MSAGLFKREPVTLDGYEPAFTLEQAKLHLKNDRQEVGKGGFLCPADDDYDPLYPKYRDNYSITILGLEIKGAKEYYSGDEFDIAVDIANEFLKNQANRVKHTEAWSYLAVNNTQLNTSKRYWKAKHHRDLIDAQIAKIKKLQAEVDRAEILASLHALEVREGPFDKDQRLMYLSEFNGGEWKDEE